jgi:plastocyanin
MAAPSPAPKTLTAMGPTILVIIILVAAFLGYYEIVYYPTVAPTTATTTFVAPSKYNITVTIPPGAGNSGKPTSFYFQPDSITVFIGYNATVLWVSNDSAEHTITAALNSPDPRFNNWGPSSQPYNNIWGKSSGQTPTLLNFTFDIPGTYNYSCSYHPWMHGEVIVDAAPPGLLSSSSSSASTSGTGAIISGVHFTKEATVLASIRETLMGSGTAPWVVNLFRSFFVVSPWIPEALTKTS